MATKKAKSSDKEILGLRRDNGWVDAFASDYDAASPSDRDLLTSLIDVAASVQPNAPDWPEAFSHVGRYCFAEEPFSAPARDGTFVEVIPAVPGTPEFADALRRATPTPAWTQRISDIAAQFGPHRFPALLTSYLSAASRSKPGLLNRPGKSRNALHGLMWAVPATAPHPDPIAALKSFITYSVANRTWQSVPGGCVLAHVHRPESLAALHQLSEQCKRPSPRQRYRRLAQHLSSVLGLSPEDTAELFVPDHGFPPDAPLTRTVSDYRITLNIHDSRIDTTYLNKAGNPVRSLPPTLRKSHRPEITAITTTAKEAQKTLLAQRDRLESLFIRSRAWPLADFQQRFLQPPLVRPIARRLIWSVDATPALVHDNRWTDLAGEELHPNPDALIRLWHPIGSTPDLILAWRRRLEDLRIVQPFKQAHREIYLLTDAERATRTYSNRFAAHVLREPQFRALAASRQWQAEYLGGWDSGDAGRTKRPLPDGWRAEFWVNITGDQHLPGGGSLYIATDQVRVYRDDRDEPEPLDQVPPLLFSEFLRDVDLFVGVASVGNDPTWQDGGPDGRYRTYWHSYAFGDLSETAQTRRQVLQSLLPRLTKLKDRWTLSDKFLLIRGHLRTYKIHLGSSNILMTPNDQYLCIVPSRSPSSAGSPDNLFLPFEGDPTLSLILSKAFLLAHDTQITDPTITRQIRL